MKGRLRDLTLNPDRTQNITFTVDADFRERFDELREKDLDVEVKIHRDKRTKDQNAYAWALIDKIAEALREDKVTVYREAIRNIGGVSDPICVKDKAVELIRESWEQKGIGWITDTMPSRIKGCTIVILYYGSSTYDTKQMGALIDHLIQDAKSLGIETDSPERIEQLKQEWAEYEAQHKKG